MLSHGTLLTAAVSLVLMTAVAATAQADRPSTDLAQVGDGSARTRVEYADLDLQSDAGARTLGERLRAATLRVCGAPEADRLGERSEASRCAQMALSSVRRAFEQRQLAVNPLAWTVAAR